LVKCEVVKPMKTFLKHRLIRIYENTNTESTSPRNKTRTTDIYCDIK